MRDVWGIIAAGVESFSLKDHPRILQRYAAWAYMVWYFPSTHETIDKGLEPLGLSRVGFTQTGFQA